MRIDKLPLLISLCATLVAGAAADEQSQTYSLVITGARIVDGDGAPAYLADVGLIGGRIAAIGALRVPPGTPILQARGRVLSPGFIDIHTHAEDGLLELPTADNYLLQGVTTVVGGNCGAAPAPLAELFSRIEKRGTAVNFACFSGHNTIRALVMGRKTATPSPLEMSRMRDLLEKDMLAGSVGLSTGLTYFPGRHTTLREIAELARILASYDGLYATHMRSEGRDISLALEEAIRIGERAGVRIQISHLKLFNRSVWGRPHLITERLESARRRGVRISVDLYPYTASSTGYSTWFPRWAQRVLRSRSTSSPEYHRLKNRLSRAFSGELHRFLIGTYPPRPDFEGKSFVELLEMLGREVNRENAAELLIDIQRRGRAQGIFFFIQEKDIESLLRIEDAMIASDGEVTEFGKGKPHCRSYGTFPRVFSEYVRGKSVLTLEEAVRRMTALPARTLRLSDRGRIREGFRADLVLFDPSLIRDTATYARPHSYPEGIACVIVNGRVAAENGRATGVLAGRVLYGPGRSINGVSHRRP